MIRARLYYPTCRSLLKVMASSNRKLLCHRTLKNKIIVLLIKVMVEILYDLAIQLVSKMRSCKGIHTSQYIRAALRCHLRI